MKVRLWTMIVLLEFCLSRSLLVTLTILQHQMLHIFRVLYFSYKHSKLYVLVSFCLGTPANSFPLADWQILSGWYLLNGSTIFNQTWHFDVLSWDEVSCSRKKCKLSSVSSSQQGLFNQNITTSTSFKLLVCLQPNWHHKLECPVEKLDYCFQGQGHTEGSKCHWLFVRMIFSEQQNIFQNTRD